VRQRGRWGEGIQKERRDRETGSVRMTNFFARRAVSPGVFGAPLFEKAEELSDRERQKETMGRQGWRQRER
jgi:hypothetical protein